MPVQGLQVGTGLRDVTPPPGLAMSGGLRPRKNQSGASDPLLFKALALRSGTVTAAIVSADLIALTRDVIEGGLRLARERSGIEPGCVIVACSHTHSGPYPCSCFGSEEDIERSWVATLPGKLAEALAEAVSSLRPARAFRARSPGVVLGHHRRVLLKSGKALNTWHTPPAGEQVVGPCGPIDPELMVLRFDGEDGKPLALLTNYALHVNLKWGEQYSADYPGVMAKVFREQFGAGCFHVFTPGACANINGLRRWDETGQALAAAAVEALRKAEPLGDAPVLDCAAREVAVPLRYFSRPQTEEIERLCGAGGWQGEGDVFFREHEALRAAGEKAVTTWVRAIRLGNWALATSPGECFVEWGLKIKRESPFPWTYVASLANDYVGYLITEDCWRQGAYEALNARSAKVSWQGAALLAETAVELTRELWRRGGDGK